MDEQPDALLAGDPPPHSQRILHDAGAGQPTFVGLPE